MSCINRIATKSRRGENCIQPKLSHMCGRMKNFFFCIGLSFFVPRVVRQLEDFLRNAAFRNVIVFLSWRANKSAALSHFLPTIFWVTRANRTKKCASSSAQPISDSSLSEFRCHCVECFEVQFFSMFAPCKLNPLLRCLLFLCLPCWYTSGHCRKAAANLFDWQRNSERKVGLALISVVVFARFLQCFYRVRPHVYGLNNQIMLSLSNASLENFV